MYTIKKDLSKYSYKSIDQKSSRIVLRTCLNLTLDDDGNVTDYTRLNESLPLIKELSQNAQNLVIMAHLGRPVDRDPKLSFKKISEKIQEELNSLNVKVEFIEEGNEISFQKITTNINDNQNKKIFLLENIRYLNGEESKDLDLRMNLAKHLASLGDVFINDAFADYRESASTYDIAKLLPSYLGPVFLNEVEHLGKLIAPKRPYVAILGGAKLSEKLDVLQSLLESADKVLIGGAMAYTLLKSIGINIGKSLVEMDKIEVSKDIMEKYKDKIVLPFDHYVSNEFSEQSSNEGSNIDQQEIPNDKIAIDIGLKTIEIYKKEIENAETIIWNGPMGVFEWESSSKGTKIIGEAIVKNQKSYKLVGGGDSISAINKFNLNGFDHICTGGGAMLAFLAYDKFPTLDVIINGN